MESAFRLSEISSFSTWPTTTRASVEHGKRIIQSMSDVCNKHGVRAAIKFQFRQLDSFIHPDHQQKAAISSTSSASSRPAWSADGFEALLNEVWSRGQLAACTPFDEESVERHRRHGLRHHQGGELLGQGLAAARGGREASGKPVICSTGGLTTEDIDNVVSFFQHRPSTSRSCTASRSTHTPDEKLALNQIRAMNERYPDVVIGWSTHESPDDTVPVGMALALGARRCSSATWASPPTRSSSTPTRRPRSS